MKTRIIAAVLLVVAGQTAGWSQAGCPKSKKAGVHVVQPGENLYRISKKYGVSVADICSWNRISENAVLSKCQELAVATPKVGVARPSVVPQSSVPTDDSPESAVIRQAQAEKQSDSKWQQAGSRPSVAPQAAAPQSAAPSSSTKTMKDESFSTDDVHVVQEGETVDQIAAMYGYRTWRFREINGLRENEEVAPGRLLRNSECAGSGRVMPIRQSNPGASMGSVSGSAAPSSERDKWTSSPSSAAPERGSVVETEQIRTKTQPKQSESEKAAGNQPSTAKPSARTDANFMTVNERTMVDEINLMRGDPAGYIKYVEEYIEDQRKNGEFGNSIATARELISELRNTPRLSILEPSECVYRAAKKHGQEQARKGSIDHQGVNGSMPWDRILESCKGFEDGNENLVGGYTDVRKSVIILLVDDGIDNRGHRRTLLEPKWKYVACYEIGPVKPYADYWVQNFGN